VRAFLWERRKPRSFSVGTRRLQQELRGSRRSYTHRHAQDEIATSADRTERMKPTHPRGTELKVGTTRHFTQPTPDVESDAEVDKPREDADPAADASSLSVPTTAEPKDI
jgi:hypothetical protein